MSNELVSVHFGGSGIRVAEKYWKKQCNDFGVSLDSTANNVDKRASTFFKLGSDDKYRPRSIFADLVNDEIEHIKSFDMKSLFNDKLMTNANEDSGCWAHGHYTDGAEIIDKILNNARKEAETADNFKGFNYFGAMTGGVSGLLTLTTIKLKEEYPDRAHIGFHGLPNKDISSINVEPYNVILSLFA